MITELDDVHELTITIQLFFWLTMKTFAKTGPSVPIC